MDRVARHDQGKDPKWCYRVGLSSYCVSSREGRMDFDSAFVFKGRTCRSLVVSSRQKSHGQEVEVFREVPTRDVPGPGPSTETPTSVHVGSKGRGGTHTRALPLLIRDTEFTERDGLRPEPRHRRGVGLCPDSCSGGRTGTRRTAHRSGSGTTSRAGSVGDGVDWEGYRVLRYTSSPFVGPRP